MNTILIELRAPVILKLMNARGLLKIQRRKNIRNGSILEIYNCVFKCQLTQQKTSSNEKVHELTTEEASNLLFGESDSDDSTDPPAKNTSGDVNVSDSQSIERTTSYLPSFSVPETQQPPANSGFFDSQADLSNASSVIAETTGEIIDDSDEEYNKSN